MTVSDLTDISKVDLSNIDVINGNIDQIKAAAADKYNIYQSLEDQVRGGKTISKSELESLEPEVQEFFSMMANGSYKMTGNAKEFYETVNNLKLDGFFQTLNAIDNEINKINELAEQNFNYNELDKSAKTTQFVRGLGQVESVDYDLVQKQLDYLDAVSAGNSESDVSDPFLAHTEGAGAPRCAHRADGTGPV